MYALIVFACIGGSNCDPTVVTDQIPTQMACLAGGQAQVASFMSERPNWGLERFICTDVRRLPFYLGRNRA